MLKRIISGIETMSLGADRHVKNIWCADTLNTDGDEQHLTQYQTLVVSRGKYWSYLMLPSLKSDDKLVISLKEARKLLGQDGKLLSDSQVIELIQTLTVVADDFLQNIGSINYNGN